MADPDYFDLADFRELSQMADTEKYPDSRVLAVAEALTGAIEREVRTSFIGRTVTETFTTTNGCTLTLGTPYVLSITSLTLNGISVTPSDLLVDAGVLTYKSHTRFASGLRGNAVVVYVAGYSASCPADIGEPLMFAVRDRLLATSPTAGIDARRTSMITDQGTINYVPAGTDHPTGYPDLDAAVMSWSRKLNTVTYP